ncbi:MAG: GNAT family N-acetyltransferase [Actinomycetota bacterium]|nr:GNAT family N-acetyltransferase [Actinomycetota bacterium]
MQAFRGEFTEHDWHHTFGGTHALVWRHDELIGHASLVARRLTHRGIVMRAGYVEAVAVRADLRGRGHGSSLMGELERLIRRHYDLGALSATDEAAAFYLARGWQQWRGATSVNTPAAVTPTPDDDGGVYVLPGRAHLDLDAEISCEWRGGDVW